MELFPRLFSIPSCGNSFIEADEDCDVGLLNADEDENKCCDSKHCKYRIDECRPVKHECDLPEICPGNSKKCPKDVVKSGTERCVGITVSELKRIFIKSPIAQKNTFKVIPFHDKINL